MCDLEKVAVALTVAQVAILAMIVLLAVGVINAGSPFTAAANIGLMVLAIASLALAIASYAVALDELNKCTVCTARVDALKRDVKYLIAWTSMFLILLVAVAVVAAVPGVGSAGLLIALMGSMAVPALLVVLQEAFFALSANGMRSCAIVRQPGYWIALVILAGATSAMPMALAAWLRMRG